MLNIGNQKVLELFYKMLKVRVFEEKLASLYEQGKIRTKLYLSVGQEAVSAGAIAAVNGRDKVFVTHRNFAPSICMEMDVEKIFREILGVKGGYTDGVAGPWYMADTDMNNYGAPALPAGNLSVAVGMALGEKIKNTGNLVLAFVGDGASNEGVFTESVNIAAMRKLPIIFLVENNGYAGNQKYSDMKTVDNIASKSSAFQIPGIIVDGNNALDMYEAMFTAASYVRSRKGPIMVEAKTYRFASHYLSDDSDTRSSEELAKLFEKCPIKRLSKYMFNNMMNVTEDFKAMKQSISDEMDEIIERILSEEPVPEENPMNPEIEKSEIEEELKNLLEQKELLNAPKDDEVIEEPSLKRETVKKIDTDEFRGDDSVFDEIKKLKKLFPKFDRYVPDELSVDDVLNNGHTHTLLSNADSFGGVDFSKSGRKNLREEREREEIEKDRLNNAEKILENVFSDIDREDEKYSVEVEDDLAEKKEESEITFISSTADENFNYMNDFDDEPEEEEETFEEVKLDDSADSVFSKVASNLSFTDEEKALDLSVSDKDVDEIIKEANIRPEEKKPEVPFSVVKEDPSVLDVKNDIKVSDLFEMLDIGQTMNLDIFGEDR